MGNERTKKDFDGNIPVLQFSGKGISEAWENSVVGVYNQGAWYTRPGPKDKGQKHVDSTANITIYNPDDFSSMHKAMTCGIEDVLEYNFEILGAKDSLVVNPFDPPGDTRWEYHYHERLAKQLETMAKGLAAEPWKRRNNGVTWIPEKDMDSVDPPCLQRIWAFIAPDGKGKYLLNLNYHFRSRNVMIAAPMNMNGLHTLQCWLRDEVVARTGMPLKNGRLVDIIDSYHVSAQDQHILINFMKRLKKSKEKGETITDRSYNPEYVAQYMEEERQGIENKIIGMITKRSNERADRKIILTTEALIKTGETEVAPILKEIKRTEPNTQYHTELNQRLQNYRAFLKEDQKRKMRQAEAEIRGEFKRDLDKETAKIKDISKYLRSIGK